MAPNPGPNALFTGQHVPLGTKTTKTFDGIPFKGSITQYNPLTGYYHVNYDDGDSEEFDLDECQKYFSVPNTTLVSPTTPLSATDPDQFISPNPGGNYINENETVVTEPRSGEKLPCVNTWPTLGETGENVHTPFPVPARRSLTRCSGLCTPITSQRDHI
eukprot:scaffold57232_cov34-Attheya_sp.AAC.1